MPENYKWTHFRAPTSGKKHGKRKSKYWFNINLHGDSNVIIYFFPFPKELALYHSFSQCLFQPCHFAWSSIRCCSTFDVKTSNPLDLLQHIMGGFKDLDPWCCMSDQPGGFKLHVPRKPWKQSLLPAAGLGLEGRAVFLITDTHLLISYRALNMSVFCTADREQQLCLNARRI